MSQQALSSNPWGAAIAAPPPPPPGWAENFVAPAAPQPVQSEPRIVYSLWELEDKMVPFQGFPPGTPLGNGNDMWDKPIGTPVPKTFRSKLGQYDTREQALLARPADATKRYEVVEDVVLPPKVTICKCGTPLEGLQTMCKPCIAKEFELGRQMWESTATAEGLASGSDEGVLASLRSHSAQFKPPAVPTMSLPS